MTKSSCAYNFCKRREKLKQCIHCKKKFCLDHITPIEPGSYRPEKSQLFVNQIRIGYENTHPCPDYVDYLEKKERILSIRYGHFLDLLWGRRKQQIPYESKIGSENKETLCDEVEDKKKPYYEVDEQYKKEYLGIQDVNKTTNGSPKIKLKLRNLFWIMGFLILIVSCLLFYFVSATINQEIKNVSRAPNEISFSQYTREDFNPDTQEVILNGFIERSLEGGNSGAHVFSIVDDHDNRILLDSYYSELKGLVPDLGKTKDLYSVQGVFKREYKTLKLSVQSVSSYKRELAPSIVINRAIPKYPTIRNFIFKAIGKEPSCEDDTKIDSC